MKDSYYKPSGKMTTKFFLYFALSMVVAIPILGTAYIYISHFVPFVYARVFFAIGCGAALGFVVGRAAKAGKARRPAAVLACALAAMLVLKYVQWCVYIPLVFTDVYKAWDMAFWERFVESFHLFIRPNAMFQGMALINEFGSWSLDSASSKSQIDVHGALLAAVWVLEFAAMAATGCLVAWKWPRFPFSEEANDWYVKKDRVLETDVPQNCQAMISSMENGNFADFVQLAKAGKTDDAKFLRLTFFQPPQAPSADPYYLTIVQMTTDRKKRNKNNTKVWATYLAVDARTVSELTAKAA